MERIDSLLSELSSRHRNDNSRFLAAVRPMVAQILDPAISDAARLPLLELLAATFERDANLRRDTKATLRAWELCLAALRRRPAA